MRVRVREKNAAHTCTQLHTFSYSVVFQYLAACTNKLRFAHTAHKIAHTLHTQLCFAHKTSAFAHKNFDLHTLYLDIRH